MNKTVSELLDDLEYMNTEELEKYNKQLEDMINRLSSINNDIGGDNHE